jgi:hypothetical protein
MAVLEPQMLERQCGVVELIRRRDRVRAGAIRGGVENECAVHALAIHDAAQRVRCTERRVRLPTPLVGARKLLALRYAPISAKERVIKIGGVWRHPADR